MSDHRTNIREAAEHELEVLATSEDGLDSWAQGGITVLTDDSGTYRVEFMTGGGGPTMWWVVDSRWGVTYHHSWGMNADGEDQDELDCHGLETGMLEDYAEMLVSS